MATSSLRSQGKQKSYEKDQDLECSICKDEFTKPKLLPCCHTFCQDCLKRHCDEHDDEKIPCPLCRSEFSVPQGGVEKLPDNQIMVRLIQQKSITNEECLCDLCRGIGENIKADSFCMECRQNLCERCTRIHSKANSTKQHKVVSIEEKPTDYELKRLMSGYCSKHDNKELDLYCCDCRELICALCHAKDHNKHDCKTSHDVAKQKKAVAENDRKNIEKYHTVVSERKQRLEKVKQDFLQQISATESSLRKSLDAIRKLLDDYQNEMVKTLRSLKDNKMKDLEMNKDLEELHYATLESFRAYSSMVNERGTDCEIIRAADDLHKRAEELIRDQRKKTSTRHYETKLKFIQPVTPTREDIKRIVGEIVYEEMAASDAWLTSSAEVKIFKVKSKWMRGLAVVDDEIFIAIEGQVSQVHVYDSHSLTELRDINIPDMITPVDLAGCAYNKALYISDRWNSCIHRVDLNNNDSVTRWETREYHAPSDISVTHEHNVLVTVTRYDVTSPWGCDLYTSHGQLLREIGFDERIEDACQSIQLSTDQFIVRYRLSYSRYRVSLINSEGQIINSYTVEKRGDDDIPFYHSTVAVDYKSKLVFVVDQDSRRVLLLDTDLRYLGQVHTYRDLQKPRYLCYDSSTDRLIVSEPDGLLVTLSPSY